jgi:SSS family solute:Na+ symporter
LEVRRGPADRRHRRFCHLRGFRRRDRLWKSRGEKDTSSDYFLAGRGLSWWLIGFSLIAANISTEQFVGMSGQAADYVGLAIASYEWMAAITLVVVAFFFLPKFLRAGIYTIPEFLEYRLQRSARSLMAAFTMIVYVGVTIAAVIYSGPLMIDTLFPNIGVEHGRVADRHRRRRSTSRAAASKPARGPT